MSAEGKGESGEGKEITVEEALGKMRNSKAPEENGIAIELIKSQELGERLKELIRKFLICVMKRVYSGGELGKSK